MYKRQLFEFYNGADTPLTDAKLLKMFKTAVSPKGKTKLKMAVYGFLGGLLKRKFAQDSKSVNDMLDGLSR